MSAVLELPVLIGSKIYKICPKCNNNHKGTCKHCAWSGCFPHGCDVGVRIWWEGSFEEHPLQIVEKLFTQNNFWTVLNYWNLMYFGSKEEAEAAMKEYDSIRKIEDRKERFLAYQKWESSRRVDYSNLFVKEDEAHV